LHPNLTSHSELGQAKYDGVIKNVKIKQWKQRFAVEISVSPTFHSFL
jgi:hypothetical protein